MGESVLWNVKDSEGQSGVGGVAGWGVLATGRFTSKGTPDLN